MEETLYHWVSQNPKEKSQQWFILKISPSEIENNFFTHYLWNKEYELYFNARQCTGYDSYKYKWLVLSKLLIWSDWLEWVNI